MKRCGGEEKRGERRERGGEAMVREESMLLGKDRH